MKLPRPFEDWYTYDGHLGIDYPYDDNVMVKASGNGTVIFSGHHSQNGGYGVTVDYGNGVTHKYKHSDKTDWRAAYGTRVSKGANLMQIGNTGLSTGPHLHHEVFVYGVIQTDDNYWRYVDKTPNAYVGYSAPAGGGGSKPLPPKKKIMETLEMKFIYVRQHNTKTIYKINLETMRSKALSAEQWSSVVASYKKLGLADPLTELTTPVTAAFPSE